MNNVIAFPSATPVSVEVPVPLMDVLLKKLEVSASKEDNNPLNLPYEMLMHARTLPIIAMDAMCQTDGYIHFAYTFEGAAALCTRLMVHNNKDLAAFGGAIFDGHGLLVSFDELKKQFSNHWYDARQWLREGCGACAAQALGVQRDPSTQWTYVDPEQLRPIMSAPEMAFVSWQPNPAQDSYRYTTAIEKLSGGLVGQFPSAPEVALDSGSINKQWATVLTAWDQFHNSKEWNAIRTQKCGNPEIGRLLGKTLDSITLPSLQERFVHLLVREFAGPLNDHDRIQIVKSAITPNVTSKSNIASMVNAISTLMSPTKVLQEQEIEHAWHKIVALSWYARYTQSQDLADLMVASAVQMSGNEDKDGKEILQRMMDECFQSHSYSPDQLNALSQYAPRAFYNKNVLTTPDDGTTVFNMLKQMKCLALTPREHSFQLQAHEFIPMITECVKNGWGGYNLDTTNGANQLNWTRLITLSKSYQAYADQLPDLLAAAHTHNPDFASDLCAALMNAQYDDSTVTQILIDSGVNWEQQCKGKSLAQLVFANEHMPLSIKTQARRALQETGLAENIVPFTKKQ